MAHNPHFGKKPRFLQGFRSPERVSRYRNADFLPRERPGGIGIQKCRFLAKRRSANAFPNRLRRSEERNAAAFIPPLFNGTEERRKASPFAARFTPTRAATRWRVSPFTPPSPSLQPVETGTISNFPNAHTFSRVVCQLLVSRLRLRGAGFSPPEQTQHRPEPVTSYTIGITRPSPAFPLWPPPRESGRARPRPRGSAPRRVRSGGRP